jgi:hypothetical protein
MDRLRFILVNKQRAHGACACSVLTVDVKPCVTMLAEFTSQPMRGNTVTPCFLSIFWFFTRFVFVLSHSLPERSPVFARIGFSSVNRDIKMAPPCKRYRKVYTWQVSSIRHIINIAEFATLRGCRSARHTGE